LPGINENKTFLPVHIAVLTVSDTRTLETDKSGNVLVERLKAAGHILADRRIVEDDQALIEETARLDRRQRDRCRDRDGRNRRDRTRRDTRGLRSRL
jgi:molybdopterin biosynthesis enzyme MoaB